MAALPPTLLPSPCRSRPAAAVALPLPCPAAALPSHPAAVDLLPLRPVAVALPSPCHQASPCPAAVALPGRRPAIKRRRALLTVALPSSQPCPVWPPPLPCRRCSALPRRLISHSLRFIFTAADLHMAEPTTVSSSSDVTQPSQPTGLPWQSGKHSIVSALAKPAYTFDGSNYGPWRGSFLEFLNAHGLRHHLTDSSPKESDPEYLEWSRLESAVCSWLISTVATQIMEPLSMTRPGRALSLKLETMYANKSNVSRTIRLYEELFACRQGTRTLQSYYGSVDAIFTNLELYQPLVLDLDALRRYRDELRAGAFLSGLRPELADMIRGQVLGGSRVLPTEEIFAAALRVQDSLPTSQSSQPIETSAIIASGGAPRRSTPSGKTRTSYPPCK